MGGQDWGERLREDGAADRRLRAAGHGDTGAKLRPPLFSAGSLLSSSKCSEAGGARLSLLCCHWPVSQVTACVASARRECSDQRWRGQPLRIERFLTKINLCGL